MLSRILLFLVLFPAVSSAQTVTGRNVQQGTQVEDPSIFPYETLVLDRIIYRDRVYSTSGKTELGDSSELDMGIRYQKDENTFARFRFRTDPSENRKDNETSNFEIIYSRSFGNFVFQLDLDLNTSNDTGGNSLGLDVDSDDTFIFYSAGPKLGYTFFPFNFRSDVGEEFNTRDVTRISYIEGSPTNVLDNPINDEEVVTKTIPGIEVIYNFTNAFAYAGFGVASYLFPTNDNFDITTNTFAESWERKEVLAYKFGYLYNVNNEEKLSFQFITQDNTEETGALIEKAASLVYFKKISKILMKSEITTVRAGKAAYNLSRTTNWFEEIDVDRPIFTDENDEKHEWLGKMDSAYALQVGYQLNKSLPYLGIKYQGPNFIYGGVDSAHRLRTDNEADSHGGLTRFEIGSYFYYNNLFFNPAIEHQVAKNPVFSNSTDVTRDRLNSSFTKENTLLTINVVYTFDGANLNPNWWF